MFQNISNTNVNTNFGLTYSKIGHRTKKIVTPRDELRCLMSTVRRVAKKDMEYVGSLADKLGTMHILRSPNGDVLAYHQRSQLSKFQQGLQFRSGKANAQVLTMVSNSTPPANKIIFTELVKLLKEHYPQIGAK